MDRTAIPHPRNDYKLVELEGESMLYHSSEGKAFYLNDTASMLWKLCDGERTVAVIENLLEGVYPEASELPQDVEAAFSFLAERGAVEIR